MAGGAALHHLQTESLSRDMSAPLLMQSLPDFTGAALETTLNLVQGNCSQHQLFFKKKETGILFFFGQTPLGPRTNISRLYFLKNSVSFAETTLTLQQDFQPISSLTIGVCFPAMCVCVEFSLQVCERQSLAVALHCWTAIPDINHPQPTLLKPERGKDFLSNPPPRHEGMERLGCANLCITQS